MIKSEETAQHIVDWLRNYRQEAGTKAWVVGVSGGIDSAVTSTLAARTGSPVWCLEMPIHQAEEEVSRARKHIGWLRQKYPEVRDLRIDLSPVFDSFRKSLPPASGPEHEMGLVNSRARLRMTALYYFAARHRALVVGTGNKVEDFGVGFFTKYGDGGVDVSPIADLLKTEVYQLAEYLGVAGEIRNAPPTDGLWGDERTDEDQLGASYPELEWAMARHEEGHSASDFTGREAEVMEVYLRLHRANLHKIKPIPVCQIPDDLHK